MRKLLSLILLVAIGTIGCAPAPKPLTPAATIAFYKIRVVRVLDVVRDAAIAGNEMAPPLISTNSTRTVVLWHKSAIQVIQAVPGGWKPAVKAGIYTLTCDVRFKTIEIGVCSPQLSPAEIEKLSPYFSLAYVVISEVL